MNPKQETWLPIINIAVCSGCGDCISVCPTDALAMEGGVAILDRPDLCIYCDLCEAVCPVDAVTLPYQVVIAEGSG